MERRSRQGSRQGPGENDVITTKSGEGAGDRENGQVPTVQREKDENAFVTALTNDTPKGGIVSDLS